MFRSILFTLLVSLFSLSVYAIDRDVPKIDQAAIQKRSLIKTLKDLKDQESKERPRSAPSLLEFEKGLKQQRLQNNGGWGGGTGVLRGPMEPLLYDLYMTDPFYRDTYQIQPNLPQTPFLKAMGYEYFSVQQLAEYPALVAHLEKWRPHAKGLVDIILDSLNSMEISYTIYPLIRIDGLVLTNALQPGHDLEPVILFNRSMNARIYLPLWNQLGDRSRKAALIHEAFRNIQIIGERHHDESQLDLKIERITNFLILNDPSQMKGYLDYTQFFDGWLLKDLFLQEKMNLSLMEYAEIYQSDILKDPVKLARLKKADAEAELNGSSSLPKGKSLTQESIDLYKRFQSEPQGRALLKQTEDYIRKYLENPNSFSKRDRFEVQTYMKALSHLNRYLQDRWLDDSLGLMLLDLKKLIFWQFENPQLDVFGSLEKYGCMTGIHWSVPIEKYQTRETEKQMELRQKAAMAQEKCLKSLFVESPELAQFLMNSYRSTR